MPFLSFKRSSSSSTPLNDDYEGERSIRRSRSFLCGRKLCRGRRSSSSQSSSPSKPSSSLSTSSTSTTSTSSSSTRRGMNFCGFCDMRIATVLLNVLHMILSIILELFEAFQWGNRNYLEEPPVLVLLVIAISGLGVFGALHFAIIPIYLSSIGMCFLWYMYLVDMHFFGMILICFILFAHAVFVIEMKRGIMTKDTYAMEEYIDQDGRKALETVRSLSVDIGETAVEFAEEVVIAVERQSSGVIVSDQKSGEC